MVAAMSPSTGAGLAVAAAAAACYETGYAFQALEARVVGARHALRASLIGQLVRNVRWLGATALSLLGWPLQVLALSLAPLALVQPTLALGLLLLLFLGARVLGEPVGRRELVAVALVIAGIACLAVAAPDKSTVTGGTGMIIAVAALAAVALAPYTLRRRRAGLLAVLSTGAADSVAALAAKLVAGELADGRWGVAIAVAALAAAAGALATVSEMSALQRLPATRVAPIVLAFQIVVPVVVVAAVGGEDWGATPLGGAVLVMGLISVVAGAVLLAASRPVSKLIVPPSPGSPPPHSESA
jgi:drug/metabolite transporter (DMT)-like permease